MEIDAAVSARVVVPGVLEGKDGVHQRPGHDYHGNAEHHGEHPDGVFRAGPEHRLTNGCEAGHCRAKHDRVSDAGLSLFFRPDVWSLPGREAS